MLNVMVYYTVTRTKDLGGQEIFSLQKRLRWNERGVITTEWTLNCEKQFIGVIGEVVGRQEGKTLKSRPRSERIILARKTDSSLGSVQENSERVEPVQLALVGFLLPQAVGGLCDCR